jgi:putative ABC transport system ATP-binding protein
MKPIVEVKNLNVIYNLGKVNEYTALKNVNLEIYPGEYVTFFGPSGCGKSTLLYTIAGLEFPTSGEVVVNQQNTKNLNKKELVNFHRYTIGMVFQAYYLIPHLNILNNVLLPQIFSQADVPKRLAKAHELMTRFGIDALAKRKPAQLSGGQQQRVAIARSLVNDPVILLADEPVGNLDSKNSEIVLKLIDDIHQKEKKTIIHVSHNPKDLQYSDRIFYMKDGQIESIVQNKKTAVQATPENTDSETAAIQKAYPYLDNSEIEAKLILNQILSPYSIETQQKMEESISQFIKGKLTQKQLVQLFDKPIESGGFNLYKQTAVNISQQISELTKNISIFKNEPKSETDLEKRVTKVMDYLIEKYQLNLNFDQTRRLKELLTDRFNFKLPENRFNQKIDQSLVDGGLGLNTRTSKKIAREVKLIMFNKKFKEDAN